MLFLLFVIATTKEVQLQAFLENSFTRQLIQELKTVVQIPKYSPIELVLIINRSEDQLLEEIQTDMKSYFASQQQLIDQKFETKHSLASARVSEQTLDDEHKLLASELNFFQDMVKNRREIQEDMKSLISQITAVQMNEQANYQTQLPKSTEIAQVYQQVIEVYKSRNVPLKGQNVQQVSFQQVIKQDGNNPYSIILQRIHLKNEVDNFEGIAQVLNDHLQETVNVIINTREQQSQIAFKLIEILKENIAHWEEQIQTVTPIIQTAKDRLNKIGLHQQELKKLFKQLEERYESLSESADNLYTSYSSKRLSDINNFNMLKAFKVALMDHPEATTDMITKFI